MGAAIYSAFPHRDEASEEALIARLGLAFGVRLSIEQASGNEIQIQDVLIRSRNMLARPVPDLLSWAK
jgi:hypothetical protein